MHLGKLTLASIVSLGLSAGHPCPGPRTPAPFPFMEWAGALELTPKQQEQIRQKFEARAKGMEAKRDEARKAHHALMQAMGDPGVKTEELRTLAAKASQAHIDELLESHALLQETAALLTPEQREKLKRMRSESPAPGRGPRGPHGPMGHPGHMPPPPPPEGM